MSAPGEFTAGDVLAASEMNALPGGVLGYSENTANAQTGISSITDLTDLSVTVTVAASRRIKITGHVRVIHRDLAGQSKVLIREASTSIGLAGQAVHDVDDSAIFDGSIVLTPSSGSHTYKLSGQVSAGTIDTIVDTTENVAFILVEDLGPA